MHFCAAPGASLDVTTLAGVNELTVSRDKGTPVMESFDMQLKGKLH